MHPFVVLTFLFACATTTAQAQTFTDHLQQKAQNGKSVTIKQSKDIDELVNHTDVSRDNRSTTTTTKPGTVASKPQQSATTATKTQSTVKKAVPQDAHETPQTATKRDTATPEKAKTSTPSTAEGEEMEIPTVDMRKKVMRRSYKVNGYRVQVFAGGNSRTDKQKAQKAGDDVKMALPEIPVYVHFYSPRWICRIGNFRTYEEANSVLKQVRELGYKQACIVSGKITVAY